MISYTVRLSALSHDWGLHMVSGRDVGLEMSQSSQHLWLLLYLRFPEVRFLVERSPSPYAYAGCSDTGDSVRLFD